MSPWLGIAALGAAAQFIFGFQPAASALGARAAMTCTPPST